MISFEIVPGMEGREVKENDGGDEFKYIWFIIRPFVNATKYPLPAQKFFLNSKKEIFGGNIRHMKKI
jgi:hypothetical protein